MTDLDVQPVVRTGSSVPTYRDRVRSWTGQALRDLAYCGGALIWSVVAFSILVSGVAVTVSFLPLVVGVPMWVGFAYVVRSTTRVDRGLAGWQRRQRVQAVYRRPAEPGFLPLTRTLSTDPQTWRNLTWLATTSVVGFAGGLLVVTAAGLAAAYVSMPLWFWAISDPGSEYGLTNLGRFTIDTMAEAATMTAVGVGLVPVVLLLARGIATGHASLAARLLGGRRG